MKRFIITILTLFVMLQLSADSKFTTVYQSAKEHYHHKRYQLAYLELNALKEHESYTLYSDEIGYYLCMCALKMNPHTADYEFVDYLTKHRQSRFGNLILFEKARLEYENRQYSKAIESFKSLQMVPLTEDQQIEVGFKLGYAYLQTDQNEEAIVEFYRIKDLESVYKTPAVYYYAHLELLNKNYQTALQGFEEVVFDSRFVEIANYYLVTTNFQLGNYQVVIDRSHKLLEQEKKFNEKELYRILGESYMAQKNYTKGLKFLRKFESMAKSLSRNQSYNMATAYYNLEEYQQAVPYFQKAAEGDDRMSQNTYFFLADCYLQLGQQEQARKAFGLAKKYTYDPYIKEEALFNYAKLSYAKRSVQDMDNEVKLLIDFIEEYPNSTKLSEAYSILIDAFTNTRKYEETLDYIDKLKEQSPSIKAVKQNIALNRGVELFTLLKYKQALPYLEQAIELEQFNTELSAYAKYWRADAFFRLGRFKEAFEAYKDFQVSPGAFGLAEFNQAYYAIGYTLFKMKNYSASVPWFQRFVKNFNDVRSEMLADAYLRLGDCSFLGKKYGVANQYYKTVKTLKTDKKDYALFQSGITLGLMNLYKDKIKQLRSLLNQHPKSAYADDALFELGKTHILLNQPDLAVLEYKRLYKDYNYSKFAPHAKLQLGLIAYNLKKYQNALTEYKEIIDKYAKTDYSKTALMAIKNIYTDLNKPADYLKYVESRDDLADITTLEKEKIYYDAAEKLYAEDKFLEAAQAFDSYLGKFPEGVYSLKSRFFAGESYYEAEEFAKSLNMYERVAQVANSEFRYTAVKKAALISMDDSLYAKAVNYYSIMEQNPETKADKHLAQVGLMRSYAALDSLTPTIDYAEKVKKLPGIDIAMLTEANALLAKSYKKTKQIKQLLAVYNELAQNIDTKEGAEAKYSLIEFNYENELYEIAEKECFDFAKKNTSQRYWLAKSFIILSKIYIKNKNNFQAKATLNSILSNYPDGADGIRGEVQNLMDRISSAEQKAQQQQKMDNRMEVEIEQQGATVPQNTTPADSTQVSTN